MRITYIARHGGHDNDDEGAIGYALEQLGHTVTRLPESCSAEDVRAVPRDFILFHKWENMTVMERLKDLPMAFWYFDLLVGDGDPRLRMPMRRNWASVATSLCIAGFCTDGDWVALDRTNKLYCLRQGADERKVGPGVPGSFRPPVLFTGVLLGQERRAHLSRIVGLYHTHILGGQGYKDRIHGRELADMIASSSVVLAPVSPITDRYWSNRVYLTLGFQGFLIHRWARELAKQFAEGEEIVYYHSVQESIDLIDYYLPRVEERARIAKNGYERVVKSHLYRHRCEELIRVMEDLI